MNNNFIIFCNFQEIFCNFLRHMKRREWSIGYYCSTVVYTGDGSLLWGWFSVEPKGSNFRRSKLLYSKKSLLSLEMYVFTEDNITLLSETREHYGYTICNCECRCPWGSRFWKIPKILRNLLRQRVAYQLIMILIKADDLYFWNDIRHNIMRYRILLNIVFCKQI